MPSIPVMPSWLAAPIGRRRPTPLTFRPRELLANFLLRESFSAWKSILSSCPTRGCRSAGSSSSSFDLSMDAALFERSRRWWWPNPHGSTVPPSLRISRVRHFRISGVSIFWQWPELRRGLEPRHVRALAGSHVVVQREFVRGGMQVVRRELVVAFVADPGRDQVRRENTTLGEVFVVFFQPVDHSG